jgi:transposase
MGKVLAMSEKERVRLVELAGVSRGEQSVAAASRRLGLSYRQTKRLWRRYRRLGDAGLVHANRGRPSNRRKSAELRQRCLELYQERLEGFGPTLAAEKLLEWGFSVNHETLRRWLVAAGLWQSRPRRARHRRWRPRKERFGELIQLDGSHHDWFELGDGTHACLMSMIDDATGVRLSRLFEEETTAGAMELLGCWIERYGIPRSLYVDRKSVYITGREPTIEEELAGQRPLTAFGAACHRLGIELIPASSPQAKGRVERSHGVYQDRLVKEIRLKGWRTLAEVNAQLASFDTGLNQRFAVAAGSAEDAHRPAGPELDLSTVLVWEETRCVRNDWTLSYQGRCLQIVGPKRHLPPAKARVTVQRRLDGSLHLFYRSQPLLFEELPQRPARALQPPAVAGAPSPRPPVRPAADHPWRRPWSRRAAATPATPPRELGAAVAYGS